MRSIAITLVFAFLLYAQVTCKTWYIKNANGYSNGCGVATKPCGLGLLSSTNRAKILAGDTIKFHDTTFNTAVVAVNGIAGTKALPINIQSSYPLKGLTITGSKHLYVSSITINRYSGLGVTIGNSSYVTLYGVVINGDVPSSGSNVGNMKTGLYITSSTYVKVDASRFVNGAPCVKQEKSTVSYTTTNSYTGCNPNVQTLN